MGGCNLLDPDERPFIKAEIDFRGSLVTVINAKSPGLGRISRGYHDCHRASRIVGGTRLRGGRSVLVDVSEDLL